MALWSFISKKSWLSDLRKVLTLSPERYFNKLLRRGDRGERTSWSKMPPSITLSIKARPRWPITALLASCPDLYGDWSFFWAVENQTHAKHEKRRIPRSRRFENQEYYYTYLLEVDFIPKSKRWESLSCLLYNLDCVRIELKVMVFSRISLIVLTAFLITK